MGSQKSDTTRQLNTHTPLYAFHLFLSQIYYCGINIIFFMLYVLLFEVCVDKIKSQNIDRVISNNFSLLEKFFKITGDTFVFTHLIFHYLHF